MDLLTALTLFMTDGVWARKSSFSLFVAPRRVLGVF
jgi:hypothetical protein